MLQVDAGVRIVPGAGQLGRMHTTPGVGAQRPRLPGTAHELQVGQSSEAQQTPSTQWALMHSLLAAHAAPAAFWGTQAPARQKSPMMQFASAMQLMRHEPLVPQRN